MKRSLMMWCVFAGVMLFLTPQASHAESFARLLRWDGAVKVRKANQAWWEAAGSLLLLPGGSIVKTGREASAVIRLSSGIIVRVDSGTSFRVPDANAPPKPGGKVSIVHTPTPAGKEGSQGDTCGTRGASGLDVIPSSLVLPSELTFCWENDQEGTSYELLLIAKENLKISAKNFRRFPSLAAWKTSDSLISIKPSGKERLEEKDYSLVIVPSKGKAAVVDIRALPPGERASLDAQKEKIIKSCERCRHMEHIMLGSFFERKLLYFDAIREYRLAVGSAPEAAYFSLAALYDKLKKPELGKRYYELLDGLGKKATP